MPYLLIVLLLFSACTPTTPHRLIQHSTCVPVGRDQAPQDLCFLTVANRYTYNERNLFFLVDDFNIEQIPPLGKGFETEELLVSPSRHYVAIIENAGEGHGVFFIIDLNNIRAHEEPRRCPGIEAYPYGFFDLQWHDDALHFSTNIDLNTPSDIDIDTAVDNLPDYNYRLLPAQDCRLEQID